MRRTRPAAVSTRSTSYTAWWDTSPRSARTAPMIESVSACGWSRTAVSTASRGRVTRSAAPRSRRSNSEAVGTARVSSCLWNQSRLGRQPSRPIQVSTGCPRGVRTVEMEVLPPTRPLQPAGAAQRVLPPVRDSHTGLDNLPGVPKDR